MGRGVRNPPPARPPQRPRGTNGPAGPLIAAFSSAMGEIWTPGFQMSRCAIFRHRGKALTHSHGKHMSLAL